MFMDSSVVLDSCPAMGSCAEVESGRIVDLCLGVDSYMLVD